MKGSDCGAGGKSQVAQWRNGVGCWGEGEVVEVGGGGVDGDLVGGGTSQVGQWSIVLFCAAGVLD